MKKQRYSSAPTKGRQGFQKTHGLSGSPEYIVWASMIARCHNPRSSGYPKYGARGIAVCDRWREDFAHFFDDMGAKPGPEYSLERKDNDGPYSPDNCIWASPLVQAYNKRNTATIKYLGRELTLPEWAAETGVPLSRIKSRFYRGLPPERIFVKDKIFREHTNFNRGENSAAAKLAEDDVRRIRALHAEGWKGSQIAKHFAVSPMTVSSILNRRNWAWLD